MTRLNHHERHLPLDLSYNLRDAGGYTTGDGRRVRWRRLLRSDSLHALTPAGQQTLRDHGLHTIIDLRRPSETVRKPNVFASAGQPIYRNLPMFDDASAEAIDAPATTLEELYVRLIDMCRPQLHTIMTAVVAASSAPLLVHCAVGKDRTGLVVALTLGALGVDEPTIAGDYALSYARLAPLFDIERPTIAAERRARFERMILSPHTTMQHTLGYLAGQYGGIIGYLEAIGIGAAQIETLRANLLERA